MFRPPTPGWLGDHERLTAGQRRARTRRPQHRRREPHTGTGGRWQRAHELAAQRLPRRLHRRRRRDRGRDRSRHGHPAAARTAARRRFARPHPGPARNRGASRMTPIPRGSGASPTESSPPTSTTSRRARAPVPPTRHRSPTTAPEQTISPTRVARSGVVTACRSVSGRGARPVEGRS